MKIERLPVDPRCAVCAPTLPPENPFDGDLVVCRGCRDRIELVETEADIPCAPGPDARALVRLTRLSGLDPCRVLSEAIRRGLRVRDTVRKLRRLAREHALAEYRGAPEKGRMKLARKLVREGLFPTANAVKSAATARKR